MNESLNKIRIISLISFSIFILFIGVYIEYNNSNELAWGDNSESLSLISNYTGDIIADLEIANLEYEETKRNFDWTFKIWNFIFKKMIEKRKIDLSNKNNNLNAKI